MGGEDGGGRGGLGRRLAGWVEGCEEKEEEEKFADFRERQRPAAQ